MLRTLEKSELVARERHPEDGRKVVVALRDAGRATIERVFPEFNEREIEFTSDLDGSEVHEMARLLRMVTATASGSDLVPGAD